MRFHNIRIFQTISVTKCVTFKRSNERQWKNESTAQEVNYAEVLDQHKASNFVFDTALADVDDDTNVQDNREKYDDDD